VVRGGVEPPTFRFSEGLLPSEPSETANRDGAVSVLKVSPDATPDAVTRLRELVARLRQRGYPAARLLTHGQVAGMTFWLQERLPGTVLGRAPDWLLPEVLRLNDAQAGLGMAGADCQS
jgi:hypothetical protein